MAVSHFEKAMLSHASTPTSLSEYKALAVRIKWLEAAKVTQGNTEARDMLGAATTRQACAINHAEQISDEILKLELRQGRLLQTWKHSFKQLFTGSGWAQGKADERQLSLLKSALQQAYEEVRLSDAALKRSKLYADTMRAQLIELQTAWAVEEKFQTEAFGAPPPGSPTAWPVASAPAPVPAAAVLLPSLPVADVSLDALRTCTAQALCTGAAPVATEANPPGAATAATCAGPGCVDQTRPPTAGLDTSPEINSDSLLQACLPPRLPHVNHPGLASNESAATPYISTSEISPVGTLSRLSGINTRLNGMCSSSGGTLATLSRIDTPHSGLSGGLSPCNSSRGLSDRASSSSTGSTSWLGQWDRQGLALVGALSTEKARREMIQMQADRSHLALELLRCSQAKANLAQLKIMEAISIVEQEAQERSSTPGGRSPSQARPAAVRPAPSSTVQWSLFSRVLSAAGSGAGEAAERAGWGGAEFGQHPAARDGPASSRGGRSRRPHGSTRDGFPSLPGAAREGLTRNKLGGSYSSTISSISEVSESENDCYDDEDWSGHSGSLMAYLALPSGPSVWHHHHQHGLRPSRKTSGGGGGGRKGGFDQPLLPGSAYNEHAFEAIASTPLLTTSYSCPREIQGRRAASRFGQWPAQNFAVGRSAQHQEAPAASSPEAAGFRAAEGAFFRLLLPLPAAATELARSATASASAAFSDWRAGSALRRAAEPEGEAGSPAYSVLPAGGELEAPTNGQMVSLAEAIQCVSSCRKLLLAVVQSCDELEAIAKRAYAKLDACSSAVSAGRTRLRLHQRKLLLEHAP